MTLDQLLGWGAVANGAGLMFLWMRLQTLESRVRTVQASELRKIAQEIAAAIERFDRAGDCPAVSTAGGPESRCVRTAGHDGEHQNQRGFRWDRATKDPLPRVAEKDKP